jgi:hypothetical protein
MAAFEELQTLWQQQRPLDVATDTASLTKDLRTYGRRQHWISLAKLVVVSAVIVWELEHVRSYWVLWGLAVVTVLAFVLLATEWRNQRSIARLNFTSPTTGFVRNAIERIMEQREPFGKYYWPFMLSMVGVLNAIDLNLPRTMPLVRRLASHVVSTTLPFVAYELARRVRTRRFEAECLPLVERLTALQRELEERSE